MDCVIRRLVLACCVCLLPVAVSGQQTGSQPIGVVSHVKVLSDKVPDVSSMEAWKDSFIRDGMSDREKALAIFKTKVMFAYQDAPPREYLQEAACVHDPIKTFNVYGYGMCCCASSNIEAMARYVGMDARGWAINAHSVSEVYWDDAWHLLDSSLINYFPKEDGKIASVEEVTAAVKAWYDKHPGHLGNNGKLDQFHRASGWTGWKKGPALLARSPFYDWGGWWPAKTHGWTSTMIEYDGRHGTPFAFEYGYSQGYQVNIQLRPGERVTRNWFHNGLHVNGVAKDGDAPGCLNTKIGEGFMAYLPKYGDLTQCRVGSGVLEYVPPLADGSLNLSALRYENLTSTSAAGSAPALRVKDGSRDGVLEIGMPTSYVHLTGKLQLRTHVSDGGTVRVQLSENNGLDWKDVTSVDKSGEESIDLQPLVLRRYDYRLRLVISGANTGIDHLKITHDVQCSQRALPTLGQGANTISFSAGPHEGTVTIQGSSTGHGERKQVQPLDFRPEYDGVKPQYLRHQRYGKPAMVTFPIATPNEMTRLRFGMHYRCRDPRDQWEMQVSFDDGKTFKTIETVTGPTQGSCRYVTVGDVPSGTNAALVRFVGNQRNTTAIFSLRIDADYRLPFGGFRPVKITYRWQENGQPRQHVHIAGSPNESYQVVCAAKPDMKSIVLELADPQTREE